MGTRNLANLQFDVHFLYPDQETFVAFAEALMVHLRSVTDWEEQAFLSRGVEVIHSAEMIEDVDDD